MQSLQVYCTHIDQEGNNYWRRDNCRVVFVKVGDAIKHNLFDMSGGRLHSILTNEPSFELQGRIYGLHSRENEVFSRGEGFHQFTNDGKNVSFEISEGYVAIRVYSRSVAWSFNGQHGPLHTASILGHFWSREDECWLQIRASNGQLVLFNSSGYVVEAHDNPHPALEVMLSDNEFVLKYAYRGLKDRIVSLGNSVRTVTYEYFPEYTFPVHREDGPGLIWEKMIGYQSWDALVFSTPTA